MWVINLILNTAIKGINTVMFYITHIIIQQLWWIPPLIAYIYISPFHLILILLLTFIYLLAWPINITIQFYFFIKCFYIWKKNPNAEVRYEICVWDEKKPFISFLYTVFFLEPKIRGFCIAFNITHNNIIPGFFFKINILWVLSILVKYTIGTPTIIMQKVTYDLEISTHLKANKTWSIKEFLHVAASESVLRAAEILPS